MPSTKKGVAQKGGSTIAHKHCRTRHHTERDRDQERKKEGDDNAWAEETRKSVLSSPLQR